MDGETLTIDNVPAEERADGAYAAMPQISRTIWDAKYRLKDENKKPVDLTVEDTWWRVATALAAAEKHPNKWAKIFYGAMEGFKFIPAGRVIGGAGSGRMVTCSNCFSGRTEVMTHSGFVRLADHVGEILPVLSPVSGIFEPAEFKCYGTQQLFKITISNARTGWERAGSFEVEATRDHRWVLQDGTITTTLKPGDILKAGDSELAPSMIGWAHGFVFGDGSTWKNREGRFRVRLCGKKRKHLLRLLEAFPDASVTYPPSSHGEPNVHISHDIDLKSLPYGFDANYIGSFVSGLLAADGCFSTRGNDPFQFHGKEEVVKFVRDHLVLAGYAPCGRTHESQTEATNYGERNYPIWKQHFRACNDHRGFRVLKIEDIGWERVYCVEERNYHQVVLRNGLRSGQCFVMRTIPDSMVGIFDALKESALTMQQGGGIGMDFSTLRYKGALVKGVGSDASGPLSFMDCWDTMCRTIESAGYRRGAMMGVMACDHPDIEAFIEAKADPTRLRQFNLSVLVTDAFMEAVKFDTQWDLVWNDQVIKTLRARDLWDKIMRATYAYAEPGVIFIDRVNRLNNLYYCETIRATNPCGEEPLPPFGACILGSLNLAALVENPFTSKAKLPIGAIEKLVPIAVRMTDNIVDVSNWPLPQQKEEAQQKRRIGIGITGLADALIMLGVRYGSPEAVQLVDHWMERIQRQAYRASADLAAEKGQFPLFDADKYLDGEHVGLLDSGTRNMIRAKGMRNSHLLSIAPTGTISQFANYVSSGLEPVFEFTHTRKRRLPDGSMEENVVEDYAYAMYRRLHPTVALPDYFLSAQTLGPSDHLRMLATAQMYVDSSISKTINLPEDISFEAFAGVYFDAYEMGCKSCTTYRPNEVTGSILSVTKAEPAPEPAVCTDIDKPAPVNAGVYKTPETDRAPPSEDGDLPAMRYKVKWPDSDHALYVIITDIMKDGRRRPYELFLTSNEAEGDEWRTGFGRMVSAVYRQAAERGYDVTFIARELQAIHDKRGGAWIGGKRKPSILACIGDVIERHMRSIGYLPTEKQDVIGEIAAMRILRDTPRPALLRQCPKCGQASLIRQENCDNCQECGYSKCE